MLWLVLMTGRTHCRRTYGYLFAVKKCLTPRQLAEQADCTRGVGLFCLSVNALLTLSVGVTLAKGHGREPIKKNLGNWMGQFAQCSGFPYCVICSALVFSRRRFVAGQ